MGHRYVPTAFIPHCLFCTKARTDSLSTRAGGPCYADSEESTGSTGSGGAAESSTGLLGSGSALDDCGLYSTAYDCERRAHCKSVSGHSCGSDKWQFISCVAKETCEQSMEESTCAKNGESDERAWFATRCLPLGWNITSTDEKCGACCTPRHYPGDSDDHHGVGEGCSFVNNSACALLEFKGACPSAASLNVWRINIIELVARVVSAQRNVSKAEATISVTINTYPRTNTGTESCAVRLQIFPPTDSALTGNDYIMALYTQLASSLDGELDSQAANIKLSGIAAYETYGSLVPVGKNVVANVSAAPQTSAFTLFALLATIAPILCAGCFPSFCTTFAHSFASPGN